jgi:uncharacterized protein YecT (DUF1311 family)
MSVRNSINRWLLGLLLAMPSVVLAGETSSQLTAAIEKCTVGSLSETSACLDNLYNKKNKELELHYKQLLSSLEEPTLLKASQSTWLQFRKQSCEYETSGLDKVGSLYYYMYSRCLLEKTDQRLSRINQYLACKDGPCPTRIHNK